VVVNPPIPATKAAGNGPNNRREEKTTADDMENAIWGAMTSLVVNSATKTRPAKNRISGHTRDS
jgi:hypothetical protein